MCDGSIIEIRDGKVFLNIDLNQDFDEFFYKEDGGWEIIAEGYRNAIYRLAPREAQYSDTLGADIFPLLFIFRHWLEISLKSLIFIALQAAGKQEQKVPMGHKLESLWSELNGRLDHGIRTPRVIEALSVMHAWTQSMDGKDPAADRGRYPKDRTGTREYPYPTLNTIFRVSTLAELRREVVKLDMALYDIHEVLSPDKGAENEI